MKLNKLIINTINSIDNIESNIVLTLFPMINKKNKNNFIFFKNNENKLESNKKNIVDHNEYKENDKKYWQQVWK